MQQRVLRLHRLSHILTQRCIGLTTAHAHPRVAQDMRTDKHHSIDLWRSTHRLILLCALIRIAYLMFVALCSLLPDYDTSVESDGGLPAWLLCEVVGMSMSTQAPGPAPSSCGMPCFMDASQPTATNTSSFTRFSHCGPVRSRYHHHRSHQNTLHTALLRVCTAPLRFQRWALGACGMALNTLFTCSAAMVLHRYALLPLHCSATPLVHRLSVRVLGDTSHTALATLLFCINPASIFFTAPYTEAVFALLSMTGMLCWVHAASQRQHTPWLLVAATLFAAATATRSNGMCTA